MDGTAGLAGRAPRSPRNPFTRIVSTAVAAGLLAGLVLTAVQTVQIVPTILQAETYEDATPAASVASAPVVPHTHEHAHESAPNRAHEHAGWKPENGAERTMFTVLANVSMGVAYALLLCAALTVAGARPTLRQGLMWGAACYVVFFVAPSLGLPPELPGTSAAPLRERQLWWSLTALSTASGLALLAFGRGRVKAIAGFVLLAAPQMIGAPQPLVHTSSAPPDLQHAFVVASALANAAFWLAVGGFSSYFFKKFE